MEIDQLVDTACERVGADDLGDDTWREGLEVLVRSLGTEAVLNEMGMSAMADQIVGYLANRLEVEQWYARHPEIDDQEIVAPLFGVGLPRTGSTALSYLLAQDPARRSLRVWEAATPCPPPETATEHTDPRITEAQVGIDFTNEMFPGFAGMLPTSATGPQECLLIMALDFRSLIFEGMALIPSYSSWLLQCDMKPAYRCHRRVLKLLQWRCPPERWWLKTPAHMLSMDALDAVYPDARFVMTHRDVGKVLPSVCALYDSLSRVLTENHDPVAIGTHNVDVWRCGLERLIAFRDRGNDDRFHDLSFASVQRDPMGEVSRLYAELGDDLTDEARRRMQNWWTESSAARRVRTPTGPRRTASISKRFESSTASTTTASTSPSRTRSTHEHDLRHRARPATQPEEELMDEVTQKVVEGAAWQEFCDLLKEAGDVILTEGNPDDPLDRAEGFRMLTRLLRGVLESHFEYARPAHPQLICTCHETIKIVGENPDNHYLGASLDGRYDYRIWGTRGAAKWISFNLFSGGGFGGGGRGTGATLHEEQMHIEPDGTFEVIISQREHPGNWLRSEADTKSLAIRQTFLDKGSEEHAELHIERIGDDDSPPDPLSPHDLYVGLLTAGHYVKAVAAIGAEWAVRQSQWPNEFCDDAEDELTNKFKDPQIKWHQAYFHLAEDEALVVEVMPPACEYWMIALHNHWMETLDYVHHQSTLNCHSATLEADGRVRFVVAHRDPGVPNWLDTAGHQRGTVGVRWVGPDVVDVLPSTTVVPITSLS